MARESVEASAVIPATAKRIYEAWLDPAEHAAMTGSSATAAGEGVGAPSTAWDGYTEAENLELEPGKRIVQAWRSADFPAGARDSRLEVVLRRARGGTRVTILHSEIPAGQGASYRGRWCDHYLEPMKRFLGAARGRDGRGSGRSPLRRRLGSPPGGGDGRSPGRPLSARNAEAGLLVAEHVREGRAARHWARPAREELRLLRVNRCTTSSWQHRPRMNDSPLDKAPRADHRAHPLRKIVRREIQGGHPVVVLACSHVAPGVPASRSSRFYPCLLCAEAVERYRRARTAV